MHDPTEPIRDSLYTLAVLCDLAGYELRFDRLDRLWVRVPGRSEWSSRVRAEFVDGFGALRLVGVRAIVRRPFDSQLLVPNRSAAGTWDYRPHTGVGVPNLEFSARLEMSDLMLVPFVGAVNECLAAASRLRAAAIVDDPLASSLGD